MRFLKTFFAAIVFLAMPFAAEAAIEIDLRIEGPEANFVSSTLNLPESCDVIESGTTTPKTFSGERAICALEQARLDNLIASYQVTDWGFGYSLDSINSAVNAPDWSQTWTIRVNELAAQTGIDGVVLAPGDRLLLAYGPWPFEPLDLILSTSTVAVNQPVGLTARAWNDGTNQFENFISTSTFWINGESLAAATGTAVWTPTATGTAEVWVEAVSKARSEKKLLEIIEMTASSTGDGTGNATSTATTTPPAENPGNGGGGSYISHSNLNVDKALDFLIGDQRSDGSIAGDPLISDWAAIAFAAAGDSRGIKLKNYLLSSDPGDKTTDSERRAMALSALGVSPYGGVNYIGRIIAAFDGRQIGDSSLYNDDIFGIFPLISAGYTSADDQISRTVLFILENQGGDGAWGGVDLTAAAVQALSLVKGRGGLEAELDGKVSDALFKAKNYLKNSQAAGGRIGDNAMSTSWAIQAIAALGESPLTWENNYHNPFDYLASRQQTDGGLEDTGASASIRLWSTAYAVPAAMNKIWDTLLSVFPKQAVVGAGTGGNFATSTGEAGQTATTTVEIKEAIGSTTPALALEPPAKDDSTATTSIISQEQPKGPETKGLTRAVKGVKISSGNYAPAKQLAAIKAGQSGPVAPAGNLKSEISANSTSSLAAQADKKTLRLVFLVSGGAALLLGLYLAFMALKI